MESVAISQQVCASGEWPKDFTTLFVYIREKVNAQKCSDLRKINPISQASKIMLKILTRRMKDKAEVIQLR